ncbi:inverted formin-2 isoform X3 [Nilaparvata lugens]|uniref:inverted formin-2 isoform X3 n=1 Tax=Nilaparvata lugens TaxID=108931 RepID=UPI00193D052E|nr:inverted formin-2 isoform X3 [Nilaparvata lugens]
MIRRLMFHCLCNKTLSTEEHVVLGITDDQFNHFLLFTTVVHLVSIIFHWKQQLLEKLLKKSVNPVYIIPFHAFYIQDSKFTSTVNNWFWKIVEFGLLIRNYYFKVVSSKEVAKRHKHSAKELWRKAVTKATESHQPVHLRLPDHHSEWEPELCIQLLKIPAAQNYSAIRRILDKAPTKWVLEFLERDGFGALLNSLLSIGNRGYYSLADTYSQLQCVLCLRAVMNSPAGLQYIVKRRHYIRKLGGILQTQDKVVKLQVFELLCTLSMYSTEGHALVLDALNYFKTCHGRKYRLDLVVSELKTADNIAYKTTLVAFINCLLFGYPDLTQRSLLRCEFYSVGLKKVLEDLSKNKDEELQLQLAVFEEQKQKDENEVEPVLLEKVSDILLKKIVDTPESLALRLVLLKISQSEPSHPDSEHIRDILENVTSQTPSGTSSDSNCLDSVVDTSSHKSSTTVRPRRQTRETSVQTTLNSESKSRLISKSRLSLRRTTSSTQVELKNPPRTDPQKISSRRSQTSLDRVRKPEPVKPVLNSNSNSSSNSKPSSTPRRMGSSLTRLSGRNGLSTVAEQTNALRVKRIFVESSTQTSNVESTSMGVQVNYRCSRTVMDSSTQTNIVENFVCRCFASKNNEELLGVNVGSQDKNVQNSASVIPPPPPLPQSLSSHSRKSCYESNSNSTMTSIQHSFSPPPPPPPLPSSTPLPPPPPPLPTSPPSSSLPPPPPPLPVAINKCEPFIDAERNSQKIAANSKLAPNKNGGGPAPPPPPPPMSGYSTLPNRKPSTTGCVDFLLKKYNTLPKSNIKMRTLNWAKIPKQTIEKSVWSSVESDMPVLSVDFKKMEELFCQAPPPKKSSAAIVKKPQSPTINNRQSSTSIVNLLDDKRSFAVNIFLRQVKPNVDSLIEAIRSGSGVQTENLRALKRLLPEKQELADIKAHAKDDNLGEAEQFFLRLSGIPDYELTIQAMLHKEEFAERFSDATSQLDNVLSLCDFLINDASLKQFMTLVLQLGNYLNAGSYAGNAVGFKLSTLPRLSETRANKPRMTFLHYAVDVANTNNSSLLHFRHKAAYLRAMSKTPIPSIVEEVHTFVVAINEINKKLKASKLSSQFGEFFQNAKNQADELVKKVELMKDITVRLADHYCEDSTTFQLHECFMLFAEFFEKVNTVFIENEHMKRMEERNARIASEREKSDKRVAGRKGIVTKDEINMVDMLMQEIKGGIFKLRRSQGVEQP